jgi:hypothetical protein
VLWIVNGRGSLACTLSHLHAHSLTLDKINYGISKQPWVTRIYQLSTLAVVKKLWQCTYIAGYNCPSRKHGLKANQTVAFPKSGEHTNVGCSVLFIHLLVRDRSHKVNATGELLEPRFQMFQHVALGDWAVGGPTDKSNPETGALLQNPGNGFRENVCAF